MKVRVLSAIFAVVFVLILLIPLLFTDLSSGNISKWENRRLEPFPTMTNLLHRPAAFIWQFNAWFTDHVGFRGESFGLYRKLMHLARGAHFQEGAYMILIGNEGYHYCFGYHGLQISRYQGASILSDEALKGLSEGLLAAKHYLDEKSIPLIVVFCPDKDEVYPEYLPKSVVRGPEPTQLDVITEFAKSYTGLDVFNTKECLLTAKDSQLVFDKDGDLYMLTHWNEIGAFFAYQDLMKHIQAYMPEIETVPIEDTEITYADRYGFPNIPDIRLKQSKSFRQLGAEAFADVPIAPSIYYDYDVVYENDNPALPTLLIMRDSYVGDTYTGEYNFWCRYLPQHFGKTIFIHHRNMNNFDSYVAYFRPDIVIFQATERELGYFSEYVSTLQDLESF